MCVCHKDPKRYSSGGCNGLYIWTPVLLAVVDFVNLSHIALLFRSYKVNTLTFKAIYAYNV